MKSGLLSTYDVAQMLKVNESTVKRWTDKGTLRCIKTPGGHRKYKMKDVMTFMDAFSYDVTDFLLPAKEIFSAVTVSADYAILTKDFTALAEIFFRTMLEGNREHTFQFLHLLYSNRITQIEIYDHILFPSFTKVGMMWMNGDLGIEQEHLASNTALHAMFMLQNIIQKKPVHGGIAVCGCLEGEHHEIGITCVNNALEANGWKTMFLGTNLPVESFIDGIEHHVPSLVCISSSTPKSQKQLVDDCRALYETTRIIHARLIVGGPAVTEKTAKRIPADLHPKSIAELISYATAAFKK